MLGLAFSGGGLKAIGEIGALKAFEDLGIGFDAVAGTSSGSSVAMLYALGYSAKESKELMENYYKKLTNFNWSLLLKGASTFMMTGTAKINGLIDGVRIEKLISEITKEKGITNMKEFNIPIAIVAVDTITANEVVFFSKELSKPKFNYPIEPVYDAPISTAVRASMSFPGVFTNCNYKKYCFIDGGAKNNLPTEPLKVIGADKIISLSFKLDKYFPKDDIMAIMVRTCDIFAYEKLESSRKYADIDIMIDVPEANLLEVSDVNKCFWAGYNAVMNKKEEVLRLCNR